MAPQSRPRSARAQSVSLFWDGTRKRGDHALWVKENGAAAIKTAGLGNWVSPKSITQPWQMRKELDGEKQPMPPAHTGCWSWSLTLGRGGCIKRGRSYSVVILAIDKRSYFKCHIYNGRTCVTPHPLTLCVYEEEKNILIALMLPLLEAIDHKHTRCSTNGPDKVRPIYQVAKVCGRDSK